MAHDLMQVGSIFYMPIQRAHRLMATTAATNKTSPVVLNSGTFGLGDTEAVGSRREGADITETLLLSE